jgi:hypothetical protein
MLLMLLMLLLMLMKPTALQRDLQPLEMRRISSSAAAGAAGCSSPTMLQCTLDSDV